MDGAEHHVKGGRRVQHEKVLGGFSDQENPVATLEATGVPDGGGQPDIALTGDAEPAISTWGDDDL